jgi:hypothetical protein
LLEDILISLPKQIIETDLKNQRLQDSFFTSLQGVMMLLGLLERMKSSKRTKLLNETLIEVVVVVVVVFVVEFNFIY